MSDSRPRMISTSLRQRLDSDPDHVLVSAGDRSFTVAEFAHRVAAVAAFLCRNGEDTPVVLLVDRSIDAAASLHGGFWSGRCVVPLGVDEPASRLEAIIARIGPCTVANGSERAMTHVVGQTVHDLSAVPPEWVDPVSVPVDIPSLIIFTSGSTGRPKGIVRQGWHSDAGWATLSREGGKTAIFGPLHWLGGMGALNRAVVAGSARLIDVRHRDPEGIIQELSVHEVTRLSVTPSVMSLLAYSETDKIRVPTLEEVVLNGESATWETVRAVRRIGESAITVRASYGASESIRGITRRIVSPSEEVRRGPLDLGEIIGDHVHLATRNEFEDGYYEVVVRKWVAAGYFDDVDLDHSRFGRADNGDPEWRSGDVVRVDADGLLWHTGRSDDLVKIAGKLVSPSEATSVLSKVDGIRRAVVLAGTRDSGRTQLIGHVEASPEVDSDEVRRMLATELPAHLIPTVLVRHDQLPLANGGKVDRQRLLSEPLVQWRTRPRAEPRNDLELYVLIEVARMLGLHDLSIDDDLWSFGLDSLGAIELSETLSKSMSTNLTANDFIGASTVAAIAKRIDECSTPKASNAVVLVEAESKPTRFIIAGAGGPALQYRALANGVANGSGVIGLEQWGLMQKSRPDRSVASAAERNVRFVLEVAGEGPLVLIGHSWGGLVAHEMAVRLSELGRSVILVMLDTGRPHKGTRIDHLSLVLRALGLSSSNRANPLKISRLYWVLRAQLGWIRRDRFRRFFWTAIQKARKHRTRTFSGEMLVIQAEDSNVGLDWRDQPFLHIQTTRGDHVSMCHVPHVQGLAEMVNTFVTSCLADQPSDRR